MINTVTLSFLYCLEMFFFISILWNILHLPPSHLHLQEPWNAIRSAISKENNLDSFTFRFLVLERASITFGAVEIWHTLYNVLYPPYTPTYPDSPSLQTLQLNWSLLWESKSLVSRECTILSCLYICRALFPVLNVAEREVSSWLIGYIVEIG